MKGVEVDGLEAHAAAHRLEADLRRQNLLFEVHWQLRRFSGRQITRHPDEVIDGGRPVPGSLIDRWYGNLHSAQRAAVCAGKRTVAVRKPSQIGTSGGLCWKTHRCGAETFTDASISVPPWTSMG